MQQILEEYQLFQLTTSHRGRPLRALQKTSMLYFNSLPHTEVDNDQRKEWLRKYISTHYLTQRQTLVYENTTSSIAISTHYLTQRQTTGDPKPEENFLNFNSLPHTEVDRRGPYLFVRNRISTHYLTQRQTLYYHPYRIKIYISTHYLTQRQTALAMAKGRVENISTHYLTQRQTHGI